MNTLLKETKTPPRPTPSYVATTNGCNTCMPLGACLAFRGLEGMVPFLHGSQGCATYIRRYLISHFREPMDIASSAFGEDSVVFGGERNLREGILNVARQYTPTMIGVATTCLAETIGDNVPGLLARLTQDHADELAGVRLIFASTPAYAGTHSEGYWAAVSAIVGEMAEAPGESRGRDSVAICPGMVSPADIRYLKQTLAAFRVHGSVLPDYSETLQGPAWDDYMRIPPGGTTAAELRRVAGVSSFIEFSTTIRPELSPGRLLVKRYETKATRMQLPIGVEATDRFMQHLGDVAGISMPPALKAARGRLIDSYVDGHKYTAGRTVALYGDADLVIAMTAFLVEIGLKPTLCATGDHSQPFESLLREQVPQLAHDATVRSDADFADIEAELTARPPELIMGSSKGYNMARRLRIPLIRIGFPVHDRVGGANQTLLGYEAASGLFEQIANLLIEGRQDGSPVGYTYM